MAEKRVKGTQGIHGLELVYATGGQSMPQVDRACRRWTEHAAGRQSMPLVDEACRRWTNQEVFAELNFSSTSGMGCSLPRLSTNPLHQDGDV